MSTGLLFGQDEQVGQWLFEFYKRPPLKFDKALGVIRDGNLVGAVLYSNWNGSNVELSYFGHRTLTLGILRSIFIFGIKEFDIARMTVITSKKNRQFMRSLQKIGFKIEGVQRCHYGKTDCNRNTGVRFVMFRDGVERIAYGTNRKVA